MKVIVTIKNTQTTTIDIGDLPLGLIRDLLTENDGTFDGEWSLGDVRSNEKWTTDSVEVVEAGAKR